MAARTNEENGTVTMNSSLTARVPVAALIAIALATAFAAPALAQRGGPPTPQQDVRWRFIGSEGNRAIAVVGEPGDPAVMYVGAASGGIFNRHPSDSRGTLSIHRASP